MNEDGTSHRERLNKALRSLIIIEIADKVIRAPTVDWGAHIVARIHLTLLTFSNNHSPESCAPNEIFRTKFFKKVISGMPEFFQKAGLEL